MTICFSFPTSEGSTGSRLIESQARARCKRQSAIISVNYQKARELQRALPVRDFKRFLVMFRGGTVKKTALEEYSNQEARGIISLR